MIPSISMLLRRGFIMRGMRGRISGEVRIFPGDAWFRRINRMLTRATEMIEAEEERMKERNKHIEAKREHPEQKKGKKDEE